MTGTRVPSEHWRIELDYPVRPDPRYGYERLPHQRLHALLDARRNEYADLLHSFLTRSEELLAIPAEFPDDARLAYWTVGWLDGLDIVALYSLLADLNPRHYVEIGSGSSTQFARRAIDDHSLRTDIISIDPEPRDGIDPLCDWVLRTPFEDVRLEFFEELEAGDIVFLDGSHRCFTNSDVTAFFLDVLPALRPGVYVHIHDVFLPYDYPPDWTYRFYSEQYVLATHLLALGNRADVVMPCAFVAADPELRSILDPLFEDPRLNSVDRGGSSFWLRAG